MADNTALPGGDTIRTKEKGSAKAQVFLLDISGSGTEVFLSPSNPLPIVGNVAVVGGISVSGGATGIKQDIGNAFLGSLDSKLSACNTGNVTIGAALPAGTNLLGSVTPVPIRASITDHSGTIALGGTAQQAVGVDNNRNWLFITNPRSNSPVSFWVNFTTTAVMSSPSIEIVPGAVWIFDFNFITPQAISVISSLTGLPYTLKTA